LSGSSLAGCNMDWAEVEMKMMYLTQEVEEAQSALARKYQEMQDLVDRAEGAEEEAKEAKVHVVQMQEVLTTSAAAHTRSAASMSTLVKELHAAAAASAAAREEEARQLAELQRQRKIEEHVVELLQEQRQELQNDIAGVQNQLKETKAELQSTKTEMKELQVSQEERCDEALQAIIQFTSAELAKVGKGFTTGVGKSCGRLEQVCTRIDSASESTSAAAARNSGAGLRVVEAVGSLLEEHSAKHSTCHELAKQARQALETSTVTVAGQLTVAEEAATAAAEEATQAMANADNDDDESMWDKENQVPTTAKAIIESKLNSENVTQSHPRTVLGEVRQRTILGEVNLPVS